MKQPCFIAHGGIEPRVSRVKFWCPNRLDEWAEYKKKRAQLPEPFSCEHIVQQRQRLRQPKRSSSSAMMEMMLFMSTSIPKVPRKNKGDI